MGGYTHVIRASVMLKISSISHLNSLFFLLIAIALTPPCLSDTTPQRWEQTAIVEKDTKSTKAMASRFEISTDDWMRYEEIMAGEGKYHWSNVDPVWVLSIYAETESERQQFARLAARQEHERALKFIKFKDAYVDNFWQMFGHEPILDLEAFQQRYNQRGVNASIGSSSAAPMSIKRQQDFTGDRLVLFMTANNCSRCDQLFMRLSQHQTDVPGAALDVHFIGDSKQNITSWAKRMGIEPSDISRGFITLNHNSEMYAQYGNPALPAAYYFDASSNDVQQIGGVDQ